MIPLSSSKVQTISWQQQLAQAITDPVELIQILELPQTLASEALPAIASFPLKVTRDYLSCIHKGNLNDPLLRQILPVTSENQSHEGFVYDPVGDMKASPTPGLIRKYHGRALLITTPACAIHCRYCFRRHYPYQDSSAHRENFDKALELIARDKTLHEIILSGGDPLTLSDERLKTLIRKIEAIEHISTLRIHSRLPVILPDRITVSLTEMLDKSRLKAVLVIHCNHPNELSKKVLDRLGRLREKKITLLNQSVLLKDINTNANVLIELSHKLFSAGVLPYYLHTLDPVAGASHFHIDDKIAVKLHKTISEKLPGYLVPKLVREIAGLAFKQDARLLENSSAN
jgi:EF-P beta-lysylation protein EpmB